MRTRRNPKIGTHPDLFGGETAVTVSLDDLDTLDEAVLQRLTREDFADGEWKEFVRTYGMLDDRLQTILEPLFTKNVRREDFTDDEWANLYEETQELIYEHDSESASHVQNMIDEFVRQHESLTEGDAQWLRDQFDEEFDSLFAQYADDLLDLAYRASSYNSRSIKDLRDDFENEGYTVAQIDAALLEALQDTNNWDYSYDTDEYGSAVLKASASDSFYMERSDLEKLTENMFEDEIERALDEINRKTYLNLKPKDLEGKYELDVYDYVTRYADADPNWDRVKTATSEILSGVEPEATVIDETVPLKERIVHTFKDGTYVVDLLPDELPSEGKAMGMCVGRPDMGYIRAVRSGTTKIFSVRRPSGKPLFTIEAAVDKQGNIKEIEQVKGKANRLPGWDLGKEGQGTLKRDEVEKVLELMNVFGVDPDDVRDLRPALRSLPPKTNPDYEETCPHCGGMLRNGRDFCTPIGAS